jgi:hypothetical protein
MYLRQAGLTRNPTFSYLYCVLCRGRGFGSPARTQILTLGTRRGTRLRRRDAAVKPTFDFADLYADRQTVSKPTVNYTLRGINSYNLLTGC